MSKIITRFLLIRDGDEVKRQIEEQYGSVSYTHLTLPTT